MQYNEIYNICQPVIDWLKEHYPYNHKIVIETTGANLIEDGKLTVLDKDLKKITSNNKSSLEIIQEHRELFSSDEDFERAKEEIIAVENGIKFLFGSIKQGGGKENLQDLSTHGGIIM